ncbi:hypothetical protein BVC80_643g2 [Macleaya cordata]|uniref:G-patch domain n=1 Tax=Macleaya cordata TaxID=56857 RepID=A0A200QJT3_MACCD|nr:hypothetical protein BVC80_643g2 [Macleaya cordata]
MIGVTEENIALGNDTTRIVRGFDNEKKNVMGEFSTVFMVGLGRKNYGEELVNLVVYRTPSKEKLPSWFDHGNTKIGHYLRKCRFFPGMGLGLRCNGPIKPISREMTAHEAPFGLGYQPTEADLIKAFQEKRWKVILTKKGFTRDVAGLNWSHQPSLNGHFIRKGDSRPYIAFREPVIRHGVLALVVTSDLEKEEDEDDVIY